MRGERFGGLLGGLALLVAVTVTAAACNRDGGRVTTGTDAPTTSAAPGGTAEALWPPAGHAPYTDPVRAARSFLEELLGMRNQPLSAFHPDAGSSGSVDVHLVGEGGTVRRDRIVSTVTLLRVDGHWTVTGATSGDIVVESPEPSDTVGSPVAVTGRGRGFEGTIHVSVLDAAGTAASPLADGFTTAGGGSDLVPFRLELGLARGPSRPSGALVLSADTGCDTCNTGFAVVPVRFAAGVTGAAPAAEPATVEVYWVDGSGTPVRTTRVVDRGTGVLRGALLQLLLGPYGDEREAGLRSALADQVAWAPSVDVLLRDGVATVDFRADLPELSPATSASAASAAFLRQLHATVFQFPTVTTAEYRVGGSCDAFWQWLQRACTTVDRRSPGI